MGETIEIGERVTGFIGMNRVTGTLMNYVGKEGEPGRTAIVRDEYGSMGGPYTVLASTLRRAGRGTSTQGDR